MISNKEAPPLSFSFVNSPFGRLVAWFRSILNSGKSRIPNKTHHDEKEINQAKYKRTQNYAFAYVFANYGIR